jgi:hypothetical protein
MNGTLPVIYWYVFGAAAIGLTIGIFAYLGTLEHLRRMRALDILKMYAEKGAEPPQAITERLAEQILEPEKTPSANRQRRGALIQGFTGFLFSACALGGLAWWLRDAGAPKLAIIATYSMTVFFSVGAVGMLLAALFSRDK